ncbi:MAG: polysaccharide biosynthesis protein [Acidobacteria bacterium]|nr:polysaccharide biosynthesis protein [Acidobacteriota bacterium]
MVPGHLLEDMRAGLIRLAAVVRTYAMPWRRIIVVSTHVAIPIATSYVAFWLRFDGDIRDVEWELWLRTLPALVTIRVISFIPARLYEGLWRYTSIWDLRNLVLGVVSGTLAFYAVINLYFGLVQYPRSVYVLDSLLLIFVLGGLRLLPRVYREMAGRGRGKRLLIFGAGDAGEMIVRDMLKYPNYAPVGFLDDDPQKVGRRIHGVRVLGTRADLPRTIARFQPDEVLVAVSRRETALFQDLVRVLQPYKVPITTVPALRHLIDGQLAVSQIREVSIEDLLTRVPVGLDETRVRRLFEGECVMVTGAGGSIGSELCRQIAVFQPRCLILFERYENSLYAIAHELADRYPDVTCELIVGDVGDVRRLDQVLGSLRPSVILHAAAHKHVPLMEFNCCEAVKNNVLGTLRLGQAAQRHGVAQFVMVSSDKAVNPSSVMGATKRVAELALQSLAPHGRTRFATVRFGNVLGSNGSVVPRFLQQIRAGGPVTVTHPDIRRYFMLIAEAVHLVLHATAIGDENDVYVLDMGEQIRLVDLAQNLIRLAGFIPDQEIRIEIVGLRPGEKLYEELTSADEELEPSSVEKVNKVSRRAPVPRDFDTQVRELIRFARRADAAAVIDQLGVVVPSFEPDPGLRRRVAAEPIFRRVPVRPAPAARLATAG